MSVLTVTSPLTLLKETAPFDERPVARTSPETLRSAATWASPVAVTSPLTVSARALPPISLTKTSPDTVRTSIDAPVGTTTV